MSNKPGFISSDVDRTTYWDYWNILKLVTAFQIYYFQFHEYLS